MSIKKGIKDLMNEKRYTLKHIQQALVKDNVPGNWLSSQNVYNLINGNTVPRDAYVYIFLSDFLSEDIRKILSRYTSKKTNYAEIDGDIF